VRQEGTDMAADLAIDDEIDTPPQPDEEDIAAGSSDDQETLTLPDEQQSKAAGAAQLTGATAVMVVVLLVVIALAGLAGWLSYSVRQDFQANQQRAVFLETARQAAVNLTTISYSEVDADIKRIVDSTTGKFHDDFRQRAPAFIDVVKQAQAKSVGTVTAAGVESISTDQARVLVAVTVKTSNAGAEEQQPRAWRMQINVTGDRNGAKVSDVQFVP
jgi:Mce-associated membrane protein